MCSVPIYYLIRHGEKPPNDAKGLNAEGQTRAQGLRRVFGRDSVYNICYILAEQPKADGSRARPFETVKPLAADLGLQIDISVTRNDAIGVAAKLKAFKGPGNVLVCWEHGQLAKIAEAVGVKKWPAKMVPEEEAESKKQGLEHDQKKTKELKYPADRFDLIWVIPPPYDAITEVKGEHIVGLDK